MYCSARIGYRYTLTEPYPEYSAYRSPRYGRDFAYRLSTLKNLLRAADTRILMFKSIHILRACFVSAIAGVLLLTACSSDNTDQVVPPEDPTPRIELAAGVSTQTTLSFVASSWEAEKCAYTLVPTGGEVPSAADILEKGEELTPDKITSITIQELTPATSYFIFAAALNGTTYSTVAQLAMTTLPEEETPYTTIKLKNAYYLGDTEEAGNWLLKFATEPDGVGHYADVYIGIWTSEIPEDLNNPVLPTGTYTASSDQTAGTYDTDASFQRMQPDQTIYNYVGGQVEITKEGSNYTIQGDLLDDKGFTRLYRYTGPVVGEDMSPHHLPRITENVNVTFERAEGTFFGDYYKNGTSLIDIGFTTGQTTISAEFVSTPAPYGSETLAAGTYTINENRAAMTLTPGLELNYAGWEYRPTGTYCKIGGDPESFGFATSGTIEVEKSGPDYTITFDLKTEEGISVKGSYSGTLSLTDGTEKPVISELEEDHVLDLSPITIGLMEFYGSWPYNNGFDMWAIEMKNESIDGIDGIQFELFLEPNGFLPEGVPTGTYQVASVAAANTLVPGFIDTYLAGSWYIWANENGSYMKKAPINSGSLTISKEGDTWTVEFDLLDDARPAHRISGSWSGPMDIVE